MKSWPPHKRLLVYLLLALALACVISPILSLGADWFMTQWPALMPKRIPFHRTFSRAFMISGIVLFILFRHALFTAALKKLFALGCAAASRDFAHGLLLSLGSILVIFAAMIVAEVLVPSFRLTPSSMLSRLGGATAIAIFAGASEEVFFRGILFMGMVRHAYDLRAYILANLFYSAMHFIKPGNGYFLDQLDLTAGFRHLAYTFTPFLDPLALLPGLIGLWLVGVVLSLAVERTGHLYLAIGLHAGWVFGLKTLPLVGDFPRAQLGWLFGAGHPKFVSGVVTWLAIIVTGVAVFYLTKNRAARSQDPLRAVTA